MTRRWSLVVGYVLALSLLLYGVASWVVAAHR
mgnify:CR=1 FL=1